MNRILPYVTVCSSENRAEWLDARRTLVGASDKLDNKSLQAKLGNTSEYTNKWAFTGTMLEPAIIRMFAIWSGMRCRPHGSLLRSKQYPFMGATLDGICRMPVLDKGKEKMYRYLTMDLKIEEGIARHMLADTDTAGLEIKAPVYRKLPYWAATEDRVYTPTKKPYLQFLGVKETPPAEYYAQVQHQMIVTGFKVVWLVGLVGGEHLIAYRVVANEEAQRKRLKLCKAFWDKVELAK